MKPLPWYLERCLVYKFENWGSFLNLTWRSHVTFTECFLICEIMGVDEINILLSNSELQIPVTVLTPTFRNLFNLTGLRGYIGLF